MVDHRTETRKVKEALTQAGIKCRVSHGTGTASPWLHITIQEQEHPTATRALEGKVIKIAQSVTGRRGQSDGRINVHSRNLE